LLERIDSIKLEKFRSNYYLFQLKIMGIVFRHGIPVLLNRPQRKRKWQTAPVSKTGLAIYYSGKIWPLL
jgi:hypothetical protein